MGTDWQYKPTNDPHKSGTQIINMLIEIRAKGGNFLLNVGPTEKGEIQPELSALLQEIALWNFANAEAIYAVKPLPVIREENVWYTQSNDEKYIYAPVANTPWPGGERRERSAVLHQQPLAQRRCAENRKRPLPTANGVQSNPKHH